MKKQWSPQCTKQIAEIYHNQSIKGMPFIKEGLKALKPELRVYRKAHLNQSFNSTSFLQDLRLPLRLEMPEQEAKSRISFKVTSNVFRKIERIREKGFSDSELFEAFVYLLILRKRKSPVEPSVEETVEERKKETSEIEHVTLRIRKSVKETILKSFPQAQSFNEAFDLFFQASENMRKGVKSTTQVEPKENQASFNYLEWAEQYPCEHRDIDYEKPNQWKCAGKKIARSICVQRQRRYINTKEGCFPQHLAHHCRNCGREIRSRYTYCYSCFEERKERKADNYLATSTRAGVDWGRSEDVDMFNI